MPINRKKYHKKHSLIRRLIQRRAGDCCENPDCRAENGSVDERNVLVQCQLAHLDQDITNNRFDNLAFLCRRCHLNHDRHWNLPKISYTKRYGKDPNQLKIPFQMDIFSKIY